MCFDNFIKKNCFFHDFTEYIHFIEEEFGNIETIIKLFRNKRMGKSLFLDAFNFYFDIGSKDQYECLFKGLKVFDYQSNFRNNMYVLKFDFSILNVESDEKFNQSLNDYTNVVINLFLNRYPNLKLNKNEIINDHDAILSMIQLRSAFAGNLLILIDEYDCPISTFFSRTNLIYYNRNESKATNTKLMDTFKRFFQTVKSLRNQTGAGKSTMLKLIYAEENPTMGEIYFNGKSVKEIKRKHLPYYRRNIGTVFQDFKLLPQKTIFCRHQRLKL